MSSKNSSKLNVPEAKAAAQLMAEIDKGWKSAEEGGWLTLEDVESRLGLTDE